MKIMVVTPRDEIVPSGITLLERNGFADKYPVSYKEWVLYYK